MLDVDPLGQALLPGVAELRPGERQHQAGEGEQAGVEGEVEPPGAARAPAARRRRQAAVGEGAQRRRGGDGPRRAAAGRAGAAARPGSPGGGPRWPSRSSRPPISPSPPASRRASAAARREVRLPVPAEPAGRLGALPAQRLAHLLAGELDQVAGAQQLDRLPHQRAGHPARQELALDVAGRALDGGEGEAAAEVAAQREAQRGCAARASTARPPGGRARPPARRAAAAPAPARPAALRARRRRRQRTAAAARQAAASPASVHQKRAPSGSGRGGAGRLGLRLLLVRRDHRAHGQREARRGVGACRSRSCSGTATAIRRQRHVARAGTPRASSRCSQTAVPPGSAILAGLPLADDLDLPPAPSPRPGSGDRPQVRRRHPQGERRRRPGRPTVRAPFGARVTVTAAAACARARGGQRAPRSGEDREAVSGDPHPPQPLRRCSKKASSVLM